MGTTFSLVCDLHREQCWAANLKASGHVNSDPDTAYFIVAHWGCPLRVRCDDAEEGPDDVAGYERWTAANRDALLRRHTSDPSWGTPTQAAGEAAERPVA